MGVLDWLTQLDKYAVGPFGVQEANAHPVGSFTGCFVDEPDTFFFQFRQSLVDIIDFKSYVVDAFTVFFEEFLHSRAAGNILKQLNGSVSHRNKPNSHALKILCVGQIQGQTGREELQGRIEVLHHQAQMGDSLNLHKLPFLAVEHLSREFGYREAVVILRHLTRKKKIRP
jgi:hypothetical protein